MKKKFVNNASWIIGCKIAQSVVALLIGMVTARFLGPDGYGSISYAQSIVSFFVPIMQLGLNSIIVQEMIINSEREGEILGTSIIMSVITSIISIFGIVFFVMIANEGDKEILIVCFLYSLSLFFQAFEIISYWFQAKLLSKYSSIIVLGAYIVSSVYKISVLINAKSIYWFAVTHVLEAFVVASLLLILYRKIGTQPLRISLKLCRSLLNKSKYYIGSSLLIIAIQQIDKVMINIMLNQTETGYYSAAITCTGITGFLFVAIIDTARPMILQIKKNNYFEFVKRIKMLFSVVTAMSLIQGVLFSALAKMIISILFGKEYLPAANALRISIWYVAFSYYGTVRNIWILAENKQRYLWLINLQGIIVNIICNYFLILRIGIYGAAIASLITQFYINFLLCFILEPLRPIGHIILESFNVADFINLMKSLLRNT